MSAISATSDFTTVAASLLRRADALAAARAEASALERTAPGEAWRRADLLWPQFTKG